MTGLNPLRSRQVVRVEVLTPVVEVLPGGAVPAQVKVSNTSPVIRSYDVTVLGIDPEWVTPSEQRIELFPHEHTIVTVVLQPPIELRAGRHTVGIRVEDGASEGVAVADVSLDVAPQPGLLLTTEPASLELGKVGTFLLHLTNTGNTTLPVELLARDPERLDEITFDPAVPLLDPGARGVVRATATGPRPWVGNPAVRVLDVTATSGEVEAASVVALVHRPRISRRLVALLALLVMISLFAFIIALSFGRVADLTDRNEALVQQGLGFDDEGAARSTPNSISGEVVATTGGGLDGAAIELYEQANPLRPTQTTVTDESGRYSFTGVPTGTYLLRADVAGFGTLWHPGVPDLADAEPIEVEDGQAVEGLTASLSGRPGGVEGIVVGADVAGTQLTVQLPATTIEGSTVDATPTVVQAIELDATGLFELGGLATPATYEIAIAKPGFAQQVQRITLGPGEVREDLEILLSRGIGVITGTVVDSAGDPIGGVEISATDGTVEFRTRSLGGEDDTGSFELRDLDVPILLAVTATAPGFFPETITIPLAGVERPPVTIVMSADRGSVGGVIRDATLSPVGSATVTVTGVDLERTTRSISVGDTGEWFVDDLPVPGTYTVTVTDPRFLTNAVSIELEAGPTANRSDVDVVLVAARASVTGRVTDQDGAPISGTEITLEGGGVSRTTRSADDPLGTYAIDRLPAGSYTLTYRRPGSTVQTLLVDLEAGEQRALGDTQLEAQAAITGIVRRDGRPLSNVGVLVYRERDYPDQVTTSTVTDADGEFTVIGLEAPETYVVDFQVPAGGDVEESRRVELRPDETVFLEVDL